MKTKIIAILALFLTIALLTACKKEDQNSFRSKITGRWKVNKIEKRNVASGAVTESINYTAAEYIDFKNNENDEVELNLGNGNQVIGNYVVIKGQSFNISFSNKLLYCTADELTGNTFKFTANVGKNNAEVTETYYLSR